MNFINFTNSFHAFHKFFESLRVFHGHLREDFAVETNFFVDKNSYELAVFQPEFSDSGIQADDPKTASGSFFGSPVSDGV